MRQLRQDIRALLAQTGASFGIAEAQAFGLDRAALGKVISDVAMENEASRIGLSVGDAEVQ
jgi:peptidyl-prolyl cis-trans isomerase D